MIRLKLNALVGAAPSEAVSFPVKSHQETHDEICPIIEDLKCYHLVKPVTGFLHFKAISYSLELIRDVRSDILLPHDHMFPTDD